MSVCRAAQPEQLVVLHTVLDGLSWGQGVGPKWLSAMLCAQRPHAGQSWVHRLERGSGRGGHAALPDQPSSRVFTSCLG